MAMSVFGEVLIVSDSDEDDELQIVSEHIVPAKTSLRLTPVEERRLLDQLDLDPNVAVKIRVSSTGGGGISRGLVGMGKVIAQCKVVSEGMVIKQKKLESQQIFEPVKKPHKDAAMSTNFSEIMTISSDDSEEEPEPEIYRKVTLRKTKKMKKPSRVTDHLIKQHRQRAEHQQQGALGVSGPVSDMGGGAGQHDKGLHDDQDASLSVSGNIQNVDIVTENNNPNLHKESPTGTCSGQYNSNQETCPINESNHAKSRNQVHPEEHSTFESGRKVTEIAASTQVLSTDQVGVQIEELLLSENLDNSQDAIQVNVEANIIDQESSAKEESVISESTAISTTKSSYTESSNSREELLIELSAESAPIEFPKFGLMRPDESDKLASPVICEHKAADSDNFNDEFPSSEDITDEASSSVNINDDAPSSEDITYEAPSSENISDEASSSKEIAHNAPCSEVITDEAPFSEDISDEAPSSNDNAFSTQNEDLLAEQFDEADEAEGNLPLPETILAESINTADVPNLLSSHKSSPDPKQVSSLPVCLSSLGITAEMTGQLFLPTSKLSQLCPPGTIVDVVSVSINLREDLVWDGWAVSHVTLATAVRVLDMYGDVFGMRKELMVKQQLGEMGKKSHQMDDQTRKGATASEVSGRKEDFLAMIGLCRMEEVESRVAEIDQRREIARSTTRLRSGNRRKQSPGEGMMGGKRPWAVQGKRKTEKKSDKKGKGKKRN